VTSGFHHRPAPVESTVAPLSTTATVLCVQLECSPRALRTALSGIDGEAARIGGALLGVFGSVDAALGAAALAERRGAGARAPRIGIAHGEVLRRDGSLEGSAAEQAARLAGRATGGQVLVGDVVELLAQHGYRFVRRAGGVEAPPAWELVWESAAGVPLPDPLLAAGAHGSFVGRDTELDALRDRLASVRAGERRVTLLAGEPGIGKTRLAAEAGLAAHAQGACVLYGRCDEGLGIPYQPFAEALEHLVAHAPFELLESAGAALGELADLVPLIRERVTVPDASEPGLAGERYVLFGAVAALLSAASAREPVVLVLDDLQWADPPTVALVRHLLAVPSRPRLLVIGTHRAAEPGPSPELATAFSQLRRDERVEERELDGLGEHDVVTVVEELAGAELGAPERRYARALHRETDGNPLFVSELVRDLGGREEIARAAAALADGGDLAPLDAPASLRELIAARAARLGAEALAVLEAAAVVGREFDTNLLVHVVGVDGARLAEVLDAAERSALVAPVAGRSGRFAFQHPLIGHTLHDHLGTARRARLHRAVGEALELEGDSSPARAPELARHWSAASPPDPERALRYAEQAGRHALEQLNPQAAAGWLRQALELHGPENDAHRCALLIGMGTAQRKQGDPGFRETLLDAARLARRLEETELLVRAAIQNTRGFVSASGEVDSERVAMLEAALEAAGPEDSRERAVLLGMLASELTFAPDRERRVALSDEAVAVARRVGHPRVLCHVLSARSVPLWAPETLDDRLASSEESVRLADVIGDPLAQFHALHWRAVALVQAGEIAETLRVVRRKSDLARRLGEPSATWQARYDEANLAILGGRLEEAERVATEALEIAVESGQPDALPFYANQLTNIRYDQGRLAELQPLIAETAAANPGIPAFRSLLALTYVEADLLPDAAELLSAERLEELPRDPTWLAGMVLWTKVCAAVADADRAALLYEWLAPFADQVVYTGISAWGDVDHALGRLATVLTRHEDAARHLEASADRYERIGAPVWLARAAVDEAFLLLTRERTGDRERARELLHEAQREGRRLGAAGIEQRATALLGHEQATSVLAAPALRQAGPVAGDGEHPGKRRASLVREGELWTLTHAGQAFHLKDSKGINYLTRLLGSPHTEVHVMDLQGGGAAAGLPAEDSAGAWLDAQAKQAYRERISELEEELAEAERFNDSERAARARLEREQIGRELAHAVGLGGRDRPAASAAERARVNATRAIRTAIRRIEECDPALGRHIDRAVRTGTFCVYDPSPQDEVTWELAG
jgi:AAA ATPase domain